MFRSIRVPPSLDKFCRPLKGHFHWHHSLSCRLRVATSACLWGRRHVAHLCRYLEAPCHRTCFKNFFVVERWDPEAALRQQAQPLLRARHPRREATLSWLLDASEQAKPGKVMDAVAKLQAPTTDAYSLSHPEVCGLLGFR
jgi:hypothetical protein